MKFIKKIFTKKTSKSAFAKKRIIRTTTKKSDKEYCGITQEFTFRAKHHCEFKDKNHPDNQEHEHLWRVIFRCKSNKLNDENVVTDFRFIDKIIKKLDGKDLNKVLKANVTVEYLAKWLKNNIPNTFLCEVFQEDNRKIYTYKEIKQLTEDDKIDLILELQKKIEQGSCSAWCHGTIDF